MNRNERYEGLHVSARIERGRLISIRNKDNICGATIARNQKTWGASKVWDAFMVVVFQDLSFAEAVNFFEDRNMKMVVSG
jgi:hypothetical protein